MSEFKIGDRVRVRKPADVERSPRWLGEMEKFDGTEQKISEVRDSDCVVKFVGDSRKWNFHFDWLEPIEPKTLNVGDPVERMQSWVPDGYSVVEMAVPDAMAASIGEGNALVWKMPLNEERFLPRTGREILSDVLMDCFLPVIVPTTPPAEQYRQPTQADVGKVVEVRDREKEPWQARELLAVIGDEKIRRRFVCRDFIDGVFSGSFMWEFARIKIEEPK